MTDYSLNYCPEFGVHYTGAGSNQASTSDFVGNVFPSGTLDFAPNEVSKTLVIEVSPDTVAEWDESFRVELSNPSEGFAVFNGNVLGTIRNDDGVYVSGYLGNNESESATSYEMATEDITFLASGVAAIDVVGNTLANHIFGNNAANWIEGREGDDSIIAEDGNDTLDGGTGADNLQGGKGDDIYYVDNLYDDIFELPDSGIDVVYASVNHKLSLNVEKLFLIDASISGSGNSLNNFLIGNGAANILNGAGGADTLTGGLGNDVYYVNNTGDIVSETSTLATEIDKVNSSVSYTLGANLENLQLTGTAAINGIGNALKNILIGNGTANVLNGAGGNDKLFGGLGNDKLNGGGGNDILTGGTGKDIFRLTNLSKDTIKDFSIIDDTIQLENAVFTKLATTGVLSLGNLKIGTTATDANDYIVYNQTTGALYYDADGNAAGTATQIALLGVNLALTHADFVVI